eukprot:gnl/Trimastix_PCT/1965.p1 GENE.gnl/Trimastix_PCT/1965~~gnl/Trimastix_PCT/1965.p1  ORF type:complete len:456 (+),score=97.40 gnl/Trimastix_PCT/1965:31-1398(+)
MKKVKKFHEDIRAALCVCANEPAVGLSFVTEHIRKSVPDLVNKRNLFRDIAERMDDSMFDLEYTISAAKTLHVDDECDSLQRCMDRVNDLLKKAQSVLCPPPPPEPIPVPADPSHNTAPGQNQPEGQNDQQDPQGPVIIYETLSLPSGEEEAPVGGENMNENMNENETPARPDEMENEERREDVCPPCHTEAGAEPVPSPREQQPILAFPLPPTSPLPTAHTPPHTPSQPEPALTSSPTESTQPQPHSPTHPTPHEEARESISPSATEAPGVETEEEVTRKREGEESGSCGVEGGEETGQEEMRNVRCCVSQSAPTSPRERSVSPPCTPAAAPESSTEAKTATETKAQPSPSVVAALSSTPPALFTAPPLTPPSTSTSTSTSTPTDTDTDTDTDTYTDFDTHVACAHPDTDGLHADSTQADVHPDGIGTDTEAHAAPDTARPAAASSEAQEAGID